MSASPFMLQDLVCRRGERALFKPCSAQAESSCYVELSGPNGAGKTTLLRTLAGVYDNYSGTFELPTHTPTHNPTRTPTHTNDPEVRAEAESGSGTSETSGIDKLYAGHRLGLDPLLTAIENLHWHAHLRGQHLTDMQVGEALARTGVRELAFVPVARMSQGQQRRVVMANWITAQACVWLLDEPLNALDSQAQQLLVDMIDEHVREGGWVVCATHTPLPLENGHAIHLEPELG